MLTEFVDRVEHLAELRSLAAGLATERAGWGMLFEGSSGIGKSALLRTFTREFVGSPMSRSCRLVSAQCRPGTGPGQMYQPVLDLMADLEASDRRARKIRKALGAVGQGVVRSAPQILATFVPGLDKVFAAGQQVVTASLAAGSMPLDSVLPFAHAAVVQIVDELVAVARRTPTILVVDDLQYCDPSSLHVFDRVLTKLTDAPIGLLLSYSPENVDRNGPAAEAAELLYRWETDRLIRRRILTGLPDEAVAQLVAERYPEAPATLSERLSEVTLGHSIFVSLCLDEWRPEQGDRIVLPDSVSRVVEGRLATLSERDRELLVIGATQGDTFLSKTVAAASGMPHDDVMERLRRIAEQHSLIAVRGLPEWASWEESDCYQFHHRALWRVIYRCQSAEQRRSRHAAVAAELAASDITEPMLERRLAIAHHLSEGGVRCLAASSDAHYALARDAAMHGLSFDAAEQHCEEAIKSARRLRATEPDRDRLLVQAIELLLSLTEVRWRGSVRYAGGPDIDALAAEAEAAAVRCNSSELLIRAMLLRGKTLMATRGLVPSLAKLRAAVGLAEAHGDPVALFISRVEYGRQVSKRNLAEGLAVLQAAERLYASDPRLGERDDPVLQHARNLAEMQLGVTLFDSGHLGQARARLDRCLRRLRSEILQVELPIAGNYLAQVHAALGEFGRAEELLRSSLEFEARRGGDSGWHAYNTALLGYVRSQQGADRADTLDLMTAAWAETERTWLANLVPIVRNLYSEVVLHYAATGNDLDSALRLASDTCVESRASGMVRSEIAAHSLRSRILLQQGETAMAEAAAEEAVRVLDEVGDMPALRTEEVLYHSAVVLHTARSRQRAADLLGRARREVDRKAELIEDTALRRSFLENVPLNRAIREGVEVGR